MDAAIGLGVIGCGGFGLFALQQFAQTPGIQLAGMAATARPASIAAAKRFGLDDLDEIERLLARPEVDLIYIATPPFLHFDQARQGLEAGKHVICEKPLALTPNQADELIAIARKKGRLLVANLMQRYNPLFEIIRRLVEQKLLGALLHGYFENYASDENLPAEHWFWDRGRVAESSSSTASTSSICSRAGWDRVKLLPHKRAVARKPKSKIRCNALCVTATRM